MPPINTIHLFPILHEHLLTLLRSLHAADWQRETICKGWTVKDITAHITDVQLRNISMYRDHYTPPGVPVIDTNQALVNYVNRLNNDWITAARRLSPAILIEWLEQSLPQVHQLMKALPPFEDAIFAVSWAGEERSANWFHIAREYTEIWHHQQQIRLAVGQTAPLMTPELYFPLLDTFMRALPHTYRHTTAPPGTLIQFRITGPGGGSWYLQQDAGSWQLLADRPAATVSAEVVIDGEIAWRLFTKGITRSAAQPYITINGNEALGKPVLEMVAVVA
jgi:uncharacterized protein (TIGR03083 family)